MFDDVCFSGLYTSHEFLSVVSSICNRVIVLSAVYLIFYQEKKGRKKSMEITLLCIIFVAFTGMICAFICFSRLN